MSMTDTTTDAQRNGAAANLAALRERAGKVTGAFDRKQRTIMAVVFAATIGFIPMGPVSDAEAATFTPAERKRLAMMQEFMQVKFGFNLLQSNQPQLVAYAISDSPVGLMAWMTQLMDPAEVGERSIAVPIGLANRQDFAELVVGNRDGQPRTAGPFSREC